MARAARACVSVMLPPPMRPTGMVMWFGESMIRRDELFVRGFGGLGGGDVGTNQDAIPESDAGVGGQGKIQLFLPVAEDFLAEGVGGEETVAAGMPVRWKTGIRGVIENGDGHRLVANLPTEIAPAAARAPGGFALFALAG